MKPLGLGELQPSTQVQASKHIGTFSASANLPSVPGAQSHRLVTIGLFLAANPTPLRPSSLLFMALLAFQPSRCSSASSSLPPCLHFMPVRMPRIGCPPGRLPLSNRHPSMTQG